MLREGQDLRMCWMEWMACQRSRRERAPYTYTHLRTRTRTYLQAQRQQRRHHQDGQQPVRGRLPLLHEPAKVPGAQRQARDEEDVDVANELEEPDPARVVPGLAHHHARHGLARLGPHDGPDEADEEAEGQGVLAADALCLGVSVEVGCVCG